MLISLIITKSFNELYIIFKITSKTFFLETIKKVQTFNTVFKSVNWRNYLRIIAQQCDPLTEMLTKI